MSMFAWPGPGLSFFAFYPDDHIVGLVGLRHDGPTRLVQSLGDGLDQCRRILGAAFGQGYAFNKDGLGLGQRVSRLFLLR